MSSNTDIPDLQEALKELDSALNKALVVGDAARKALEALCGEIDAIGKP